MTVSAGPEVDDTVDLAVIGGGINGAGIARDAAGRGLSVHLIEMDDLASATSSWSTKLVHGGLRYLEHFEFRLVREALIEREVLWAIAPHIIRPLRFVLPHRAGLRPAALLRLGLFLYDHIGGRAKLPGTTKLALESDPAMTPLRRDGLSAAFEYSDCFVDDARLVVLNAVDAAKHGARISTRTKAVRARREGACWHVDTMDAMSRQPRTLKARALVNAAGPWVAKVLSEVAGRSAQAKVRLVQGSHIVVRRLFEHDRAYILQNEDGRIVFAIPYQGQFTLIGTTDRDYDGDPAAVTATVEEIDYLIDTINANFARRISTADVIWRYSGVRPLYDDGASEAKAATRDYVLELDDAASEAPLLSVFGGKITTYRRLAEHALARLADGADHELAARLRVRAGWTATAALPGGDFTVGQHGRIESNVHVRYPFLALDHVRRLVAAYGTLTPLVLGAAKSNADLGRNFGANLTEAEVRYLVGTEFARTADDIVWRRSKLGLHLTPREIEALDLWLSELRS